mmetsp:Transcript_20998/g.45076  ORF Transcript_20998/g.45076 Transcript_20998/m.45076 type:complete len:213 (+) Transcript_20998:623-1261(+)
MMASPSAMTCAHRECTTAYAQRYMLALIEWRVAKVASRASIAEASTSYSAFTSCSSLSARVCHTEPRSMPSSASLQKSGVSNAAGRVGMCAARTEAASLASGGTCAGPYTRARSIRMCRATSVCSASSTGIRSSAAISGCSRARPAVQQNRKGTATSDSPAKTSRVSRKPRPVSSKTWGSPALSTTARADVGLSIVWENADPAPPPFPSAST